MLKLPDPIIPLLHPFERLFRQPAWLKAQILLLGAILTTGKRTVSAALRVMGLSDECNFAKYHHVLNRAVWSPHRASETLLRLLLHTFDQRVKPLVFGLDETIGRRWGRQIKARGIYRDPVRTSSSHFVKASGLRWLSMMWLTEVPWAKRVWGLPLLTWARQMIYQLRCWLSTRSLGHPHFDARDAAQLVCRRQEGINSTPACKKDVKSPRIYLEFGQMNYKKDLSCLLLWYQKPHRCPLGFKGMTTRSKPASRSQEHSLKPFSLSPTQHLVFS